MLGWGVAHDKGSRNVFFLPLPEFKDRSWQLCRETRHNLQTPRPPHSSSVFEGVWFFCLNQYQVIKIDLALCAQPQLILLYPAPVTQQVFIKGLLNISPGAKH